MRNDWFKIRKDLQDRLEKSIPADLKDYVGLIDGKGNCDSCNQKKVLFLDRATKKSLCLECSPLRGYEYTAVEFNNMWQLAQDTMYYANEIILELMYPNLDFTPITPEKIKTYLDNHGWDEDPIKGNNPYVRRYVKMYKDLKFTATVPASGVQGAEDLVDYKQAVVFAIELISKVEGLTPYEVFQEISSL